MKSNLASPAYNVIRPNRFFDANVAIVEYEVPKFIGVTFLSDVDLTELERVRASAQGPRPTYTAFVARAVALALKEFPYMNGRVYRPPFLPFFRPRVQHFRNCDVSVAVERLQAGMEAVAFVDMLRNVDQLSLEEIGEQLSCMAQADTETNQQWREFSHTISRLPRRLAHQLIRLPCFFPGLWVKYRGGAALVSSPAKYGVDRIVATWPWPLGVSFGLVKRRPVVKGDEIVACPTFNLTLTFDRRLVAGAQAAQFFKYIIDLLENAGTKLAANAPFSKQ